jgi:hypothetical protein
MARVVGDRSLAVRCSLSARCKHLR